MDMRRSRAAEMIDDIREALASRTAPEAIEAMLQNYYQVEPLRACDGAAHSNVHIDNCGVCMPRWGYVGAKVVVK
jgi:hypothetical protein